MIHTGFYQKQTAEKHYLTIFQSYTCQLSLDFLEVQLRVHGFKARHKVKTYYHYLKCILGLQTIYIMFYGATLHVHAQHYGTSLLASKSLTQKVIGIKK